MDLSEETSLEAHPQHEKPPESPKTPALVINIYSWATPLIGALMLIIGLLAGYFGRPLLAQRIEAQETPSATEAPVSEADAANRKEMMDFLISQVKHFKGDPSAPVTMIEFGDFQ